MGRAVERDSGRGCARGAAPRAQLAPRALVAPGVTESTPSLTGNALAPRPGRRQHQRTDWPKSSGGDGGGDGR